MFGNNEAAYGRMVRLYFKDQYEQMKKECKQRILMSGNPFAIIVDFSAPSVVETMQDPCCKLTANVAMHLLLVQENQMKSYPNAMVIYQPSIKQVEMWSKSPAARKAKIKFALS